MIDESDGSTSIELPQYNVFTKSEYFSEEDMKNLINYLKNHQIVKSDAALEKSPDLMDKLERLIFNQISWIREKLGLDVSLRAPDLGKINFYEEEEWNQLAEKLDLNKKAAASTEGVTRTVIALKRSQERQILSNLNHDLLTFLLE